MTLTRRVILCLACAALGTPAFAQPDNSSLAGLAKIDTSFRAGRVSSGRYENNWDSIGQIAPGETLTILDATGPARIVHIWMTAIPELDGWRTAILRMYWDHAEHPSVEVPLGKFFGLGFGDSADIISLPVVLAPGPGMNCFWPMPFRRHARVTLTNQGELPFKGFFYIIDLQYDRPMAEDEGYFHASYRQLVPGLGRAPLVILEATGEGHYVGAFVGHRSNTKGWWGEGDDFIYIDGEEHPSLIGTGTEDYFGGAWGFFNRSYNSPYMGHQITDPPEASWENVSYRFHIPDPVPFRRSIRVELERGDLGNTSNDHSAVAFWYQRQPASEPVSQLPPMEEMHGTARLIETLRARGRWDELRAFYQRCFEQSLCVPFQRDIAFAAGLLELEHNRASQANAWFRRLVPAAIPVEPYTRQIRHALQQRGQAADEFPLGSVSLLAQSLTRLEAAEEKEGRVGYKLGRDIHAIEFHLLPGEGGAHASLRLALDVYDDGNGGIINARYLQRSGEIGNGEFTGTASWTMPGKRGWHTAELELKNIWLHPEYPDLQLTAAAARVLLADLRIIDDK